ncbi:cilia- and flagella-associated protein 46-like isoform X2 [Pseudoliparis swirei]|uniref:cilia- and flagella-associated protein 46-like isoform X2 n=1 Tax=Pseudoliparis swirei TaxID=2059687 RepID=UPI0024BE9B53|nr:cilia- and flagella-associated protein 46-like isoform X2 [Pseudoliparis swirei]
MNFFSKLGCVEMSSGCLKRFFEGNPPANQFLCRAYLCRGRLESPPATGSAVRTVDTSPHGELGDFEEAVLCFLKAIEMSKRDPRDWLQALSADATSDFLRAAELEVAMEEPWLVANAAVYLWNYSGHLLAAGEHRRLLPTFQSLVAMLRTTEFTGEEEPLHENRPAVGTD